MTGLDLAALCFAAIAAGAALAAAAARGATSTAVALGVATAAGAGALALFDAQQTALVAVTWGAAGVVAAFAAALIAPETKRAKGPVIVGALGVVLGASILTALAADTPSPIALARTAPAEAADVIVALALALLASGAVMAVLGQGERSALTGPRAAAGAFPGREHAVARGVGKGLSPVLAIVAVSLAASSGVGGAVAGGALLGAALALYALVFGLDAALRLAPPRFVLLGGWIALAAAIAVGAAPTATGGAPFDIAALGAVGRWAIAAAEGTLRTAVMIGTFSTGAAVFFAVAARLAPLPAEDEAASGGGHG